MMGKVQELLQNIEDGAVILDLGCDRGSFHPAGRRVFVVRVDLAAPAAALDNFVRADAACLPFPARSFDAIVSNHSLEHIEKLDDALREIGRVAKPGALLYVAVPDASTFSDRLYRWLARGGGHVNPFTSAEKLAQKIELATGLQHRATTTLYASFSFMNRANRRAPAPRKMWLVGGGTEASLRLATWLLRRLDRAFGTRWSVYGWALFFCNRACETLAQTRANVCVRCGAGHDADWLTETGRVRRSWLPFYLCPACGAKNYFTRHNGR